LEAILDDEEGESELFDVGLRERVLLWDEGSPAGERVAGSDVLRVAWTGVVVELDEEEDRCALSVQKVMAKRSDHGEIDEAPFIEGGMEIDVDAN
jgi:hypothetical protein